MLTNLILKGQVELDLIHEGLKSGKFKVNERGNNDDTPLLAACFIGNFELVKFLLSHGAKVNLSYDYEYTALSLVQEFDLEFVQLLLDHGATVEIGNLILAADYSKLEQFELLLKYC